MASIILLQDNFLIWIDMLRWLRRALELIAGLAGAIVFLGIILVWRLDHSTATATFLTAPIKAVMDQVLPGLHSNIEHTLLEWNNTDHSLSLHADNINLDSAAGVHVIVIPSVDLEVSPFGLLLGHFLPTVLKIEHPQVHLVRYETGQWYFGESSESDPTYDVQDILENIVDNLAEAHLTRKLEVSDATLDIEDRARHKTWSVSVPHIILERQGDNLDGLALVNISPQESSASLELLYHHEMSSEQHDVTFRFHDFVPASLAGGNPATVGIPQAEMFDLPLTGEATFSFDNQRNVDLAHLDIHGGSGNLKIPDFWDQPREIKSFNAKIDYDEQATQPIEGTAVIDFHGPKLSLLLHGLPSKQEHQDIDYDLNIQLDQLPLDSFGKIWPKSIITNARDWIVTGLSKGQLNHGEVEIHGSLAWQDPDKLTVAEGHGKLFVSGAHVNYLEGMPTVDDVDATSDFDLHQMNIQINTGHTGNLKIVPFVVQIADLDKDIQTIDIPVHIEGSVDDVVTIIDAPRFSYAKALGLSLGDITGDVQGIVHLRFPLLKLLALKDVEVTAHADLGNLSSAKLGHHLNLIHGNMTLDLDKSGLVVQGPMTLNKADFHVNWRENFDAKSDLISKATVAGALDGDQWGSLGIDAFSGTKGPIAVTLQIERPSKSQTKIDAVLDMGAAEVHVPMLNWKKLAAIPASLTFGLTQSDGNPLQVHDINLQGPQTLVKGEAVISEDASHLLSLDLPSLVIGRSKASLSYVELKDSEHTMKLEAQGQSLDIAGLKGSQPSDHTDSRPQRFVIRLAKLYTSDTGFMTNIDGYALRDSQGWREINLRGRVQGESWLDISLLLKQGRRQFSVMCDDFGKALNAMGFTSAVANGSLKIIGNSTIQNPRVIEGTFKVGSFSVNNLPLLANLLNATSPFGIVDMINKTISFDRLTGAYRWQDDDIDLIKTNLPGSSIGINIEGHVNMNTGQADLHGTLVPFSMVNRFLDYIPMIGDLITGGKGQGVLAVAYTITGALSDPHISVNPISLLTPGFIRNLFFEEDTSGTFTPPMEPGGVH